MKATLIPETKPVLEAAMANIPISQAVIKQASPLELFKRSQSHILFSGNINNSRLDKYNYYFKISEF